MLCKRSYEKEDELPQRKNFICRKLFGYDLNKYPNIKTNVYSSTINLGNDGKRIIKKFMKDNEKKEKILKDKDDYIFKYFHSKHRPEYNTWKYSNHIIKEFSRPPIDKIYSFAMDIKPKPKYMTKPFRRPKINGDYFDKNL